jgi:DNA polymerase-1
LIVTKNNLFDVIRTLTDSGFYGLDTETFGLAYHHRLFSIQISSANEDYYFNYLEHPDHLGCSPLEENVLPRTSLKALETVFKNTNSKWFIHNAKFDLQKLLLEGLRVNGSIHCTQAIARVIKNNHLKYDLNVCCKRALGIEKDDAVEKYISEHKLYENEEIAGKKKKVKNKFYDQVPFDIMVKYGMKDSNIVRKLGIWQINKLAEMPDLQNLAHNEMRLTKALHKIQSQGLRVNVPHVKAAFKYETENKIAAIKKMEDHVGMKYSEVHFLKKAFDKFGYKYKIKEKTGNAIFDKEAMAIYNNPVAKIEEEIRHHDKLLSTYYSSFLHHADHNDILRASINQAGTETGRFSYSNPNLQNIPKEDEGYKDIPYLVRASFIPREDYCFGMIDYDQQEFRLMLDYAGERELIDNINRGHDVHQATADMVGVTRTQAKRLNFALLYGMGIDALAKLLDVDVYKAKDTRARYFSKLPRVQQFIRGVSDTGAQRGYVRNWYGRRCNITNSSHAYKLPNHIIQGGCADIIKIAMNKIDSLLEGHKSCMLLQVHDELLFEWHKDELHLQQEALTIMENIYQPMNGMKLTCGVDHSWVSWGQADKVKGMAHVIS